MDAWTENPEAVKDKNIILQKDISGIKRAILCLRKQTSVLWQRDYQKIDHEHIFENWPPEIDFIAFLEKNICKILQAGTIMIRAK